MRVINLTPHTINFVVGESALAVAPSGIVARVSAETRQVGETVIDGVTIPVEETVFGEVTGLPEPEGGVIYIVSGLVAQKVTGRDDIFVPGRQIRDEEGRVVGCASLARPTA